MPVATIKTFLKGRCQRRRKWLQVSSPCEDEYLRTVRTVPVDCNGTVRCFCPVCKRPLTVEPVEAPQSVECSPYSAGRCCYVVVLWGESPGYVLGAMVLAKSLLKVGTVHDLVLLHTSAVSATAVGLLQRAGWKPRQVEPIDGVTELYNHGEPRFKGVFTKLRVLALRDYEKVLCMDIDTLATGSMDELFDLEAPAANGRGPQNEYNHGDPLDGTSFFRGGSVGNNKSWGQCWGINAGVMLLRPNEAELRQMTREVLDGRHPSHIRGNGPEQDYLSRYWANCWKHIGVEYNFQMHQMYHVLHERDFEDSRCRLMRQFAADPKSTDIHLIHYSGSVKPWARFLDKEYSDMSTVGDAFFLRSTLESFNGYWLWGVKDPDTVKGMGAKEGVMLGPTGKLHWIQPGSAINWTEKGDGSEFQQLGREVILPDSLVQAAETVARVSITWWNEVYEALAAELGFPGIELANQVAQACAPPLVEVSTSTAWSKANWQSGPSKHWQRDWRDHGGWWVEHPVVERASVLAGRFPEPFVSLTAAGSCLLDTRGDAASGLHAVSFSSGEAPRILCPGGDVRAWSEQVSKGSAVLIACVDMPTELIVDALTVFVGAGFGNHLPKAVTVPAECSVFVLALHKGVGDWSECFAAADFAKVTLPLPDNVLPARSDNMLSTSPLEVTQELRKEQTMSPCETGGDAVQAVQSPPSSLSSAAVDCIMPEVMNTPKDIVQAIS